MIKWLKKIFQVNDLIVDIPVKTLNDLEIFDTVWVQYDNILKEGWVFDKTKKRIIVVVEDKEFIFYYSRPYDKTELTQNNKILFFNKPC